MRQAQYHFVSEEDIKSRPDPKAITYRVSVNRFEHPKTKAVQYSLYFPKDVIRFEGLANKRIRLYADERGRAIAWRILDEDAQPMPLDALAKAKVITPMPSSGNWTASITKLMRHANIDLKESRRNVPVTIYRTTELGVPMVYYTISLK
jgi:hypothetical protein